MTKLTLNKKKSINGGAGVMAAWIAIMGVAMLGNIIASTITSVTDKVTASDNQAKSYSYSNSKKSMYMRMSPFPARSVVSMWM